jgi:hypothetical protein
MKIVKVKPVPSFCNGKRSIVEYFNLTTAKDNLEDDSNEAEVTFIYTLFDCNKVQIAQEQHVLTGADYMNWDSTGRHAYEIMAGILELEIVNLAADFGGV